MSNLKQTRLAFAIYCVNAKKLGFIGGLACSGSVWISLELCCSNAAFPSLPFAAQALMMVLSRLKQRCCQRRKSRTDIKIIFSGRLFFIQSAARVRKRGIFPKKLVNNQADVCWSQANELMVLMSIQSLKAYFNEEKPEIMYERVRKIHDTAEVSSFCKATLSCFNFAKAIYQSNRKFNFDRKLEYVSTAVFTFRLKTEKFKSSRDTIS